MADDSQGDLRGDPVAPRTPTAGTRDPHSASSAAPLLSAPKGSLLDTWFDRNGSADKTWQPGTRALCEQAYQDGLREGRAAADPALLALPEQWREQADGVEATGYSQQADRMRQCAADLDAVLLGREGQKVEQGKDQARGRTRT